MKRFRKKAALLLTCAMIAGSLIPMGQISAEAAAAPPGIIPPVSLTGDPATIIIDGVKYNYNDEGTNIAITGCSNSGENLVLPSEIAGKPVTKIWDGAFKDNTVLKSIVVPESVVLLGDEIFYGCTNLENVEFKGNIRDISRYMFAECRNLKHFTIPESVYSIDPYSFYHCGIEEIVIPDGTSVFQMAFYYATDLKSVDFGTNIDVSQYTFCGCSSLVEFKSKPLQYINNYAFYDCGKLKTITMSDPTHAYGTPHIGESAFENCTSLTGFVLPSDMKELWANCFKGCTSLIALEIPKSVTTIKDGAYGIGITGATIYGETGTAAEQYAKDNNIKFVEKKAAYVTAKEGSSVSITKEETFGKVLTGMEPSTTVADLKGELTLDSGILTITNKEGETSDSAMVGTGTILKVTVDGNVVETIQIKLLGDVNGDGIINVVDMEGIQKNILGLEALDGIYLEAAKTAGEDTVSVVDMECIQKDILGLEHITQK